MVKLSKAAAPAIIGILLMTQPGCITQALLKLGEPSGGPTEQPVRYTQAVRDGRMIVLKYESTVDADGNVHSGGYAGMRYDLATAQWLPLGAAPVDPYCTREMWLRLLPNAPPQPPAALIPVRPSNRAQVALLHKQQATGFPPMSVQLHGLDAWIVCGAGDAIGLTTVPAPPPPESGERSTGATVAIVLLFPFALALDITFGVFYGLALLAR
jgi:hypothetical protein